MPNQESPAEIARLLNRPLAIVGMACRLPGAEGLDAFWDLLRTGSSAITRMPDDKLNRELYFDPEKGKRGKTYSDIGGFILEREIDWSLMPIERSDAGNWDKCHLILCEVAATACRDAGWDPRDLPNRNAAVFVGHSGGSTIGGELAYRVIAPEYVQLLRSVPGLADALGGTEKFEAALLGRIQAGLPERDGAGRPFTEAGYAAGIISRALGLTGPHMSIDAACASSLVALSLAAATLQTGQSDVAIVGGASYNKSDSLILFSQAQSCSASGSRPFDEDADGLISSEGYVAIVLKTLARAVADGDRVHALIHGIGVSSDGRGKSLWAPRKEGQYTAISRAYSDEVAPSSVQMIEAHATSTQVGDATEMEALSQFFRERCGAGQRIPVGSVKSNIGHTLETAGLAGLVKAVLSIQHATVPPSINVRNLSRSIPWSQIPLYVPHACEAWPTLDANTPRRAAVNAFGIGGLNVHVVIEQHLPISLPRVTGSNQPNHVSEPIAVIGRGLVLPGAANVEQFRSLLQSAHSQIGPRDGSRQKNEILLERNDKPTRIPLIGGYVRGFEYDWRKHKVPPKQIAQANPLQFMLLEAAEQALREGRCYEREFDRQNTAVVVGSVFGGDFGNALFAGLRLPEFKNHLMELLREREVSVERAKEWAKAYEEKFLKINPALLDETGSFTSSTLASRLSKTFDLMGGALAIDGGDVSSFAALQAASQLLQSRAVNQVMCAAAQRSLDRAAMETLARIGYLPGTSPVPHEGYNVGEGVAVVLLKRLSDARRDGDQVWATIDGIAAGFDARALDRSLTTAFCKLPQSLAGPRRVIGGTGIRSIDDALARGLQNTVIERSPLIQITGHLQAAQGLADLIATTIDDSTKLNPLQPVLLTGHALSGQSYVVSLAAKVESRRNLDTALPAASASDSVQAGAPEIWRFAAKDSGELQSMLAKLAAESIARVRPQALRSFDSQLNWRVAIVCDAKTLASKLTLASKQVGIDAARIPLAEQGVYWSKLPPNATRVAWMFPGQGSQYRGMLEEVCDRDEAAGKALAVADVLLKRMGQPSFHAIAGHEAESLGEDVWLTQAAMLVADWVLLEALRKRGHQPYLVCGHSFGEFAAMLAAGCWDLESALRATWYRCQAIVQHVPAGFGMLSIQADAVRVRELLAQEHFGISISHINAAQQIVVGGRHSAVVEFAQMLDDVGITSRMLAVPTAFHTPALQPAQAFFQRDLASIDILPPRVPLLSSVTNHYEADPARLAVNLVQQLVQPIDFQAMCERLKSERVGLAVEVGPQQVLTRLLRQNVGDAISVVACDQPKRSGLHQLLCVEANLELHAHAAIPPTVSFIDAAKPSQSKVIPVHFDATQKRRDRMRNSGRSSFPAMAITPSDAAAVLTHDATEHHRSLQPSVPTVEAAPVTGPTVAHSPQFVETFLIDFVVEQTGYPAEIIELDWDIEADLGIDSIKKAQLFGELREFFDLESLKSISLDRFRTLRDIAIVLEQTPGKADWLEPARSIATPISQPLVATSSPTVPVPLTSSKLDLPEPQLTQFLIDFVVEQTGYPAEIVELDADLEADLGIDSIKKAQLFGELREMFQFSAQSVSMDSGSRQGLTEYRTLRSVLDAMIAANPTQTPETATERNLAVKPIEPSPIEPASVRPTKLAREWPAIVLTHLGNGAANVATAGYRDALQANLRALIGRDIVESRSTRATGDDAVHQRDSESSANLEVAQRLALAADTTPASVRSLSGELLVESSWRLSVRGALAELLSPTWITDGGGDLAAVMVQVRADGDSITIGPAGSTMPTAMIHDLTLLVVGGLFAEQTFSSATSSALEKAKLSDWIQRASKLTIDECVSEVKRMPLIGNWWVLFIHAPSRQRVLVESRNGETVIDRGGLVSGAGNGKLQVASSLAIYLDDRTNRFLLRRCGSSPLTPYADLLLDEAWLKKVKPAAHDSDAHVAQTENVATRYELQMRPAVQRASRGRLPLWNGAALVVGDNPIARQLEARLRTAGVTVTRLKASEDPHFLAQRLTELSAIEPVKHLFIATPCDAQAAITLDETRWNERRNKGIMGIFWLCQRWLNQVVASESADDSSLVSISAQGGDFGFSGNIHSAEGGGVGGLLKSILIEGWMQGIRTLPIKVIDTAPSQSPAEVVDCVWRELAVPSYDLEVSYFRGVRHVVRAIPRPVVYSGRSVPRGGTWVCTGGARGITAFVAEELAKRYALKLHLLGTASLPDLDPAWRNLDDSGLRRLKAQVMTTARDAGQNPIKTWQDTEKALEIDATLRRFAKIDIEAHYHACDVSDRKALRATLAEVRRISGPIEGVLHGAGVGKDARFDRKQPDKVSQCIAAKVDGSLALMDATQADPLKYFVGFGSISGRFGANGHTDYSLSNEMLCKQIDWLKRQRPDVKAIGFHWHAWGDVGMATKPETRLALEMIDMQFMPAAEGLRHLIAELEGDSDATEVLITDDRYYRAFYPAETLVAEAVRPQATEVRTPLLIQLPSASNSRLFTAKVDPVRDPFLAEHRLDGNPLLPFVIAAEMFVEAAMVSLGNAKRVVLQNVEAVQGLRFFSELPRELKLESQLLKSDTLQLSLHCDFLARDGRLVESNRRHFTATATTTQTTADRVLIAEPPNVVWMRSAYPATDAKFQVGWPFQRLRKFALTEEGLIGKIAAPALIELAGVGRDLRGWQIPCAALDACLFAVGLLAWQRVAAGTALPIRFGRLEIGRLPSPGEACQVHVRLLSSAKDRARFDFTLYGVDGEVILNACDYEVAWLLPSLNDQVAPAAQARGAN